MDWIANMMCVVHKSKANKRAMTIEKTQNIKIYE